MNYSNLNTKLLLQLTAIDAISGNEKNLANFLLKQYQKYQVKTRVDNLGNVIATKESAISNPKKILVVSHMDEVGFIAMRIDKQGFIYVQNIGGLTVDQLPSTRVRLTSSKTKQVYQGTISSLAPHLGVNNKVTIKDLQFDFGFKDEEEAKVHINLGDMICFDEPSVILCNGKRILSKAIDDRYGVFMGLELLNVLNKKTLPYELIIANSVQEEVGSRGAITLVNQIKPDFAIVLDASPARDNSSDELELGRIGQGVLIRFLDGKHILNKKIMDLQIKACQQAKVKYQYYQSPGATDAGEIHKALNGIPTLVFGLAARGIHSPSAIYDLDDLIAIKKSLIVFLNLLHRGLK